MVLQIFEETEIPLTPKDVEIQYTQRGWPPTKGGGDLYDAIFSTIAYLRKSKGLLTKVRDGYVIARTKDLPTETL